ncbi:MAG: tachylectin-related carbohydrate-binding protein [Pseudomonadota bacterium]
MGRFKVRAATTLAVMGAFLGSLALNAADAPDGPIGKVGSPLVGGTPVSLETREKFGLLTLRNGSGTCSAQLLRNNWAITAAHCVEGAGAMMDTAITLTAKWATYQQRQSMRVITFRPSDIAIIRVASPFTVNGSTTNYNRGVFESKYYGRRFPVQVMAFGRGISQFAQGSGAAAMKSVRDDTFRVGNFTTSSEDELTYTFPSEPGVMVAGGDSGGGSFVQVKTGVFVLMGVHSSSHYRCLGGQTCQKDNWDWIAETTDATDALIEVVWDDINRYIGAFYSPPEPAQEPPPPAFTGTFGATPANYQSMWVYVIKNSGELLWYRKEAGNSPFIGPRPIGNGWAAGIRDVIPAGGNAIYVLTDDGTLRWYQHDGFNDGTFKWKGPIDVARGWNYQKIFSGGEGVIYAIRDDGALIWYRHGGYADGGGIESMSAPRVVGSGWSGQRDVFSSGGGNTYVVRTDGTLSFYKHLGYLTGEPTWTKQRNVGTGWHSFSKIVSAGDGVILGILADGKVLWYKHLGLKSEGGIGRLKETWEGRSEIGHGFTGFKTMFALLPTPPQAPR